MKDSVLNHHYSNERDIIKKLVHFVKFSPAEQKLIALKTKKLIYQIRQDNDFAIEELLTRYSLSSDEGVAILTLAEALLRVPDRFVANELIKDKLSNKDWGIFIFQNAKSIKTHIASLGLYGAGSFANLSNKSNILSKILNKIGNKVFIKIMKYSISFITQELIFADNIHCGLEKASQIKKYKFSFDILGESARTKSQSKIYYRKYIDAISAISKTFPFNGETLIDRPNISIKLTALYPRFELIKLHDIEETLLPQIIKLVNKAKKHHISVTFDAEEMSRHDIYYLFLMQLIKHPDFATFSGIGLVVQAYHAKSYQVVEQFILLARQLKKQIPIRLVKGAYWDTEIKLAQEQRLQYYPVFTKKEYTDINYLAIAKNILNNIDAIYPQFATHNALTASSIIELAGNKKYELQKLYGMGNALYKNLITTYDVRIYAPIGNKGDLLSYLIRRMLENATSANFASQVNSENIPLKKMIFNIHDKVLGLLDQPNSLCLPEDIYNNRKNAMGYNLGYKNNYDYIQEKVQSYFNTVHNVCSIIDGKELMSTRHFDENFCPGKNAEKFSSVSNAIEEEINDAINSAYKAFDTWSQTSVTKRALILNKIADSIEENKFELYAILIKESGKSIHDAVNEVMEAVDFCRYYASQAQTIMQDQKMPSITGEANILSMHARGTFACISPWNFPLAIFVGQIVAALVSGNTVIAKPSSQSGVIANLVTKLMHRAGIPKSALQLIISYGSNINKYVIANEKIAGVAFTGSYDTAKAINTTLSQRKSGIIPLIAETGGLNAMIVDSSTLLEQVTDDVLMSAFYAAGQRCSALRMLYVQEEIYDELFAMIKGAVELLKVGDTTNFAVDIGPVIDLKAHAQLTQYITDMKNKKFKIFAHPQSNNLKDGNYVYPHIIEVQSINDIPDEQFGPILHIAKYKSKNLDNIINEINQCGFGLTFGIHTRIESKIEDIRTKIKVGNIYANRSIIGAQVESQPFGGENKSGTGFKAGGPNYLLKFMTERTTTINKTAFGGDIELLNSQ